MSSLTHLSTPEKEELNQKQALLLELEQELADKELLLSTYNGELRLFEKRYNQRVGAKYAELEEVNKKITELESQFFPGQKESQSSARSAWEQVDESDRETWNMPLPSTEENAFVPTEDLRKLYREAAKKIHPDLTADPKERERRHDLMARLNKAYDDLAEEKIRAIIEEWEEGRQSEEVAEEEAQLARTERKISQVCQRLDRIRYEIDQLKNSEMFKIKKKIEAAEKRGRDIFAEMIFGIDEKISASQAKIRNLEDAIKWYRKCGRSGLDLNQYQSGFPQYGRDGALQISRKALQWFCKAAEQACDKPQHFLEPVNDQDLADHAATDKQDAPSEKEFFYKGYLFWRQKEYDEAVKWFQKYAMQGYAPAQNQMGSLCDQGAGVAQDFKQAAEWFHQAADQGYAEAQCNLGLMYFLGDGVEQNFTTAFEWFKKAAERNITDAQLFLGILHENGKGAPQDNDVAVSLYRKAADQGNAVAQNELARMYYHGKGVEQDFDEAMKWYRKSAELGNDVAQYNLGRMYLNGEGVPQNAAEAAKWYRRAAEQGHDYAQYNLAKLLWVWQNYGEVLYWLGKSAQQGNDMAQCHLGVMYEKGEGVSPDNEEAVKWYRKAAEQGNHQAQNNLGMMYFIGKGVPQNYEEAARWYRKAAVKTRDAGDLGLKSENVQRWLLKMAEKGSARAQNHLGSLFEQGTGGVQQSYWQSVKWYQLAAEQGDDAAQYNLGRLCYHGIGLTPSKEKAFHWFLKSAEQGNGNAQYMLGEMYGKGEGVSLDHQKSFQWYRRAAEQGVDSAQYHLGRMYRIGVGIDKNNDEAVKWYRRVAKQEYPLAIGSMKKIKNYISL